MNFPQKTFRIGTFIITFLPNYDKMKHGGMVKFAHIKISKNIITGFKL